MDGYEAFTQDVLGVYAPHVSKQATYHRDLREGIIHSQDIAYANQWEGSNLNIFKQGGFF